MLDLVSLILQAPAGEKWLFQSEKINTVLVVVLLVFLAVVVLLVLNYLRMGKLEKSVQEMKNQAASDAKRNQP